MSERSKKRFTISSVLQTARIAAPFAAALVVLSSLAVYSPSFLLIPLKLLISALFLYQLVALPISASVACSVTLVCMSLFFVADPADASIKIISAGLLLGFRRGKLALPPFISLFLSWGLFLLLVQFNSGLAGQVISGGWLDVLVPLLAELTFVSIFIVFSAYKSPENKGAVREISGLNFFIHLNAVIFVFISAGGLLLLGLADRASFTAALNYVDSSANAVLTVLLPLFFAPVLSGAISAWVSGNLLGAVRSIAVAHQSSPISPVFITELIESTAEVERTVSRLHRTEEERRVFREEKTRLAEQLVSLSATLNADRRAICVVDTEMRLIWANAAFFQLFSVASDQVGSSKLTDLEGFEVWFEEISTELAEVFNTASGDGSQVIWSTRAVDGLYAHISATRSSGLYRGSRRLEAVLSFELRPDMRQAKGQILAPRPAEACSHAALVRSENARDMVSGLSIQLSRIGQLISNTLAYDPDGAAAVLERLLTFLSEIEADTKRASNELNAFAEMFQPGILFETAGRQENFDLAGAMDLVADFCRDTVPHAPKISVLRSREGDRYLPYFISGTSYSCALFTAYCATVVRLLADQENNQRHPVEIKLDHENLTPEVASVLPGSVAGRYVRIDVTRKGARLRSDLIGEQQGQMGAADSQIEAAISMLAQLVRSMGGVVSVQNASHRGINLSLYLTASNERRPSLRRRKNSFHVQRMLSRRSSLRDILVLTPQTDSVGKLTEKLRALGYEVSVERPDSVLREINSSMGLSGSGFGAVSDQGANADSSLNLNDYKLLIVDVAEATSAVLAVLEQLEEEYPEIARLLVSDQSANNAAVERYGVPLPVSMDDQILAQAIDELFQPVKPR